MITQQNYFSYNIIDVLYYNQPTGEDMADLYGIPAGFKRRNPIEYNKMTENEQRNYDENEKKFIQAVINKYVIDDYNNKNDHTIGTYIGNLGEQGLPEISYAYLNSRKEIGIELSDMVSNINGTHNYKLISAKDIDFDNVILPNSAITRDFNWGAFDINRRWGDKPIRINNTFELLNVIDYLLCACDNLWNELYKIKYSVNDSVQIWFTKDVSNNVLIHSSYKLVTQDFQLNSESGRTNATKMITYLDPTHYYTSLNNNVDNMFGVVTNFYTTVEDVGLNFDRKIVDIRNRNIILMVILPSSKEIQDYVSTISQNIDGQLQQIYAYKIGDELKIYPGSRIETFSNENYIKTNPNDLIDFTNKKLKNETYFKSDSEHAIYSKIYIKFLDVKQLNISLNDDDVKNPYFLYYINNDNKKVIIAYNYENSGEVTSQSMKDQLLLKIQNVMSTYVMFDFTANLFSDQIFRNDDTGLIIPKFYVLSDEFFTTLEVATPNSKLFSSGSKSITIYYYKNRNKLNCTVTRIKNDQTIEILPEEDLTQARSLAYHGFRYNVPDGQEITFKFDSSYIALDNTSAGNPLGIKLDDEYYDIMFYGYENVDNDAQASQYYKLNDVDSTGLFKRNFEQFTKNTFESNKTNYVATDINGTQYKHVWKKQENPYKLNLSIDNDEFIAQSLTRQEVINEINIIKNNNELRLTSYNTYTLNHTLTEGVEQVKMDLRFSIDETSKVKTVECIIPININKIYNPTINYYTKSGVLLENSNYSNVKYKSADNTTDIILSDIYNSIFNKYNENNQLNSIPDIGKYMYGTDLLSLEEFGNQKTYDCTFNNTYFEFTYNTTSNIVNLIGSWYMDKYVSTYIKHGKRLANAYMIVNNNSIVLKNNTGETIDNHPYIFNINGFGKNYRLHGGGNAVSDIWKKYYTNNLDKPSIRPWHAQFDLLSVSTINNYGSINKQLKVKLNDGGFQLTNICISSDNEDKDVWTVNNLNFNSGLNTKLDGKNNDNQGWGQPQEEVVTDYIIKTLPVDIVKTSYQVDCNITFNNSENEYMTYYVPLTYMYINSSTFYPPLNTIPSGNVADLNDPDEVIKYHNYVESWKSEDNYRPITMSLKLFDNTTITNPYYYESNEAVMKFNIKRSGATRAVRAEGIPNIIYVSLNSKYYLSDFIHVGSVDIDINQSANTITDDNPIDLTLSPPVGSYFYYNDTYKTYVIAEILTNYKHDLLSEEHNSHYKYFNGNNIQELFNPDILSGNNSGVQKIVPYPIFHKEIKENNEMVFSPTMYNYDIYRVSDINKINMNQNTTFVTNVIYVNNEAGENVTIISNIDATGIVSHSDTYSVDIEPGFINNFADLKSGEGGYFNTILYKVKTGGLIGSKNYTGTGWQTDGTITIISPIIRKKIVESPFDELNLYHTVNYSGPNINKQGIYEFFEFKYEDVYEIKKITTDNNINVYEIKSIAPTPQPDEDDNTNNNMNNNDNLNNEDDEILTCEEAYNKQLELFLLNSPDDFIGTLEFYENHYNNQ